MAVSTPQNAVQVEDRVKVDVQREAPDSDPYVRVHWLRSLISGFSRRIFDFYQDLNRTEARVMPDTADEEFSLRWGNIYVGPINPATGSTGSIAITGVATGVVPIGTFYTSGGLDYITTSEGTISAQVLTVSSITRSGATATVTTDNPHDLVSVIPVTIAGAGESEYNTTDNAIVVTGLNTFTYQVSGTPATPASGTITASFTSGVANIDSVDFGANTNLDLDTPLQLQSPIVNVDDTASVTFGTIGGGSDEETIPEYKARYLEKIRDPLANFNDADIRAQAKTVSGVTRVFVEGASTVIGAQAVTSITRVGNVATVTTPAPHGYDDGSTVSILGANQAAYNVVESYIIIESTTVFHYIVFGSPVTPATGTITSSLTIPLGQVRTFFMRDNDPDPIPSAPEVATVKAKIDEILPATTFTGDNIVSAPTGVTANYVFTDLVPNTSTMQAAIDANIAQFHAEETVVSQSVDEDAYRAAITNTIDPDTGDKVSTFTLSSPTGDIAISSGEISIKGTTSYPVIP